MKFNRYVFDLYLQSAEGKESLQIWTEFLDWRNWETLDFAKLTKTINSSLYLSKEEAEIKKILDSVKNELLNETVESLLNPEDPNDTPITWEDVVQEIRNSTKEDILESAATAWENSLNSLIYGDQTDREAPFEAYPQSIYYSVLNPQFFFPYFFVSQFWLVEKIFEEFDLILPPLPKAKDYKARLNYYFELSEILYDFRETNEMKPEEFFAFLYGFVGNFVKNNNFNITEKPLQIRITGGSRQDFKLIQKDPSNPYNWAGNINTKKGDLQLIYFRTPISAIACVSTCLSDGYYDPFDYYENRVLTSNFRLFSLVTLDELKVNPIWSKKGLICGNMQGVKGQLVSIEEYNELRKILVQKGESPDILPELESIALDTNLDLKNEKDVEEKLLEPLLQKLGFADKDWVRQLSVRMGRGERNYPDCALFVDQKIKGEETAKFLWEAKFRISNEKQLRDTFYQAKSYARRLDSKVFSLVAVEGIWISSRNDDFEYRKLQKFTWQEVGETSNWVKIKDLFQKIK